MMNTIEMKKKKKDQRLFPWWCLFIAYGLSFLLMGLSILFIIARGIEFGEIKVEKWLTSLITSFLSSLLLSQPIKVCFYILILYFYELILGYIRRCLFGETNYSFSS